MPISSSLTNLDGDYAPHAPVLYWDWTWKTLIFKKLADDAFQSLIKEWMHMDTLGNFTVCHDCVFRKSERYFKANFWPRVKFFRHTTQWSSPISDKRIIAYDHRIRIWNFQKMLTFKLVPDRQRASELFVNVCWGIQWRLLCKKRIDYLFSDLVKLNWFVLS